VLAYEENPQEKKKPWIATFAAMGLAKIYIQDIDRKRLAQKAERGGEKSSPQNCKGHRNCHGSMVRGGEHKNSSCMPVGGGEEGKDGTHLC